MKELNDLIDSIVDIDDRKMLKNIITRYILETRDKKRMINDINNGYFNFDKIYLESLRDKPLDYIKKQLYIYAEKFISIGEISKIKNFEFPNILTACSDYGDTAISYCKGTKFIISKKDLDNMIDILASEVIDPLKWKWLFNSVYIDKSFNFFRFIRRQNEVITIEFIN